MLGRAAGLAALELNLSCPNVVRRRGLRHRPGRDAAHRAPRAATSARLPLHRQADAERDGHRRPSPRRRPTAGPTPSSLVNTFVGMAIDWRRRRPVLGNVTGGLSGPAIKPLALRMRLAGGAATVQVPIVGVGGIATLDDVMEFLVAGASAVQIGTANFYDPTAAVRIVDHLSEALGKIGCESWREAIGAMGMERG